MLLPQGLFWKWGLSLVGRVVAEGVTPWTWSVINTIHPVNATMSQNVHLSVFFMWNTIQPTHPPMSQDVHLSESFMWNSAMPTKRRLVIVKSAMSVLDRAWLLARGTRLIGLQL